MSIYDITEPFVDAQEYSAYFSGRRIGFHAAVVKQNDDPKRLGRVKVYCPSVYGDELSPWCTACFPTATGMDTGTFEIPPLHSYAWITFEEGDPRSPIYMGGFAIDTASGRDMFGSLVEELDEHQDNESPLSMHAQGLPDGTDVDGVIRDYDNVPPAQGFGAYGYVSVRRTPSGSCIELNDTPDRSRLFLLHGKSGAYYEIRDDGTILQITPSKVITHDAGVSATHDGPCTHKVRGSKTEVIGGEYSANYLNRYKVSLTQADVTASGATSVSLGSLNLRTNKLSLSVLGNTEQSFGEDVVTCVGGNAVETVLGSKVISAVNALDPTGLTNAIAIEASNGEALFRASDLLGVLSKGVSCTSGDVYLGDTSVVGSATRVSPVSVPLAKEGVVMSTQLHLALSTLIGHFVTYATTLSTGGTTPGFGGPNPVLAIANINLGAALSSWLATYAPIGPKVQPLYASDSVFVSK